MMYEQYLSKVTADMKLAWDKANEVVPKNQPEGRTTAVAIIAAAIYQSAREAVEKSIM